jgi:hypothetical protein
MGAHSSDGAERLLLLMTSFAAVKAKCAAVEAKCTAVMAECTALKAEGAVMKVEGAAEYAAVKADNGAMTSDINSLQRYVSTLHTTGEEAAAGCVEWVSSRPLPAANGLPAHTYTGQMRGGMFHGFGRASFGTGAYESYDGQWKEDEAHGQGVMKYSNGSSDEGRWEEGLEVDGTRYNRVYEDGKITSTTLIV